MWTMMGFNDGNTFNISDSFNGRKLPLIPGSTSSTTLTNNNDIFALNRHMVTVMEQGGKREFNIQSPPAVSSRWNPTPEQLRILEELYGRGTRTPTADQIQHITSQLCRFGKIEGKNVFYWFQNHKARERQKRRRSESSFGEQKRLERLERRESGFEVEQAKNWTLNPIYSTTLAEESVSMQNAANTRLAERGTDGRIQFEEGELHKRRSSVERYATWQMMELSTSSPPLTNFLKTAIVTASRTVAAKKTDREKLINTQDYNVIIASKREEECRESQTLELFPLRSNESNGSNEKETDFQIQMINNINFTPFQFFEFLPLKN